jgi:hypothetical protein
MADAHSNNAVDSSCTKLCGKCDDLLVQNCRQALGAQSSVQPLRHKDDQHECRGALPSLFSLLSFAATIPPLVCPSSIYQWLLACLSSLEWRHGCHRGEHWFWCSVSTPPLSSLFHILDSSLLFVASHSPVHSDGKPMIVRVNRQIPQPCCASQHRRPASCWYPSFNMLAPRVGRLLPGRVTACTAPSPGQPWPSLPCTDSAMHCPDRPSKQCRAETVHGKLGHGCLSLVFHA